jgi:hypothetical protein
MRPQQAADDAVSAALALLKGSGRDGVRVESVFWYGAVELGAENLVVWVLLSGAPDEDLPEWYFPVPGQLAGVQTGLTPSLREWLDEMREAVRTEFAKVGWPDPTRVSVGFDSSNRVEAAGGFAYFR